jgi:hypothetical protein
VVSKTLAIAGLLASKAQIEDEILTGFMGVVSSSDSPPPQQVFPMAMSKDYWKKKLRKSEYNNTCFDQPVDAPREP